MDLLSNYQELPEEVIQLLRGSEELDYQELIKLNERLNELGYSFEFGLDGVPYNLTRLSESEKLYY